VLSAGQGKSNTEIAERLHFSKPTVGKWRQRFLQHRLAGLYDELRSGRPRSIDDDQIAALLKRTLSCKPTASTHWSVRQSAKARGISKSTVHRLFQTFAIQPHRTRSFKISCLWKEPDSTPEPHSARAAHGLGLCREGVTQDYVRHGTTTSSRLLPLPPAPSSPNASRAIDTRSSLSSCVIWMPASRRDKLRSGRRSRRWTGHQGGPKTEIGCPGDSLLYI
jgi:transposase